MNLAREIKKEWGGDDRTNRGSCTWKTSQKFGKMSGEIENQWKNRDHLYHSVVNFLSLFNGISTFVGYLMPKPFS